MPRALDFFIVQFEEGRVLVDTTCPINVKAFRPTRWFITPAIPFRSEAGNEPLHHPDAAGAAGPGCRLACLHGARGASQNAAQSTLRQQYVAEAALLYIRMRRMPWDSWRWIGINPPLNKLGKAEANPELLFQIIARARHRSTMAAWTSIKAASSTTTRSTSWSPCSSMAIGLRSLTRPPPAATYIRRRLI